MAAGNDLSKKWEEELRRDRGSRHPDDAVPGFLSGIATGILPENPNVEFALRIVAGIPTGIHLKANK